MLKATTAISQLYVKSPRPVMLSWKEAVAILERCDVKGVPIPFDVTFVTADESAGTGGEIIHYDQAIWYVPGGRVRGSRSAEGSVSAPDRSPATRWMRRIRAVASPQIRQLHIHLILSINGQRVR